VNSRRQLLSAERYAREPVIDLCWNSIRVLKWPRIGVRRSRLYAVRHLSTCRGVVE